MDPSAKYLRALRWLNLGLAAALAVLFLFTAFSRLTYPYELEFEEGDLFLSALRVPDGKTIYPAPTEDPSFIPVLYVPLYYYLCAPLLLLFGRALWVCRLLSVFATLSIAVMVFFFSLRRGADRFRAVTAGLLFLAFFPAVGFWYDLARLDSVFLALALGAFLALSSDAPGRSRLFFAALLLTAATFTKQVGVFYIACASVYLMTRDFRRGLLFGLITTALTALIGLAWHFKTNGNFSFYVLAVGASHEFHFDRLLNPLPILKNSWPLFALVAASLARAGKEKIKNNFLPIFFLGASIPCTLLPWAKTGNYLNDFIPVFLALSILFGVLESRRTQILLLAQFALLFFNPYSQIPTAAQKDMGEKFIAGLRADSTRTYVLDHPYYSWLAGKETFPKGMFIAEAEKAGRPPSETLVRMIDTAAFDRILVDLQPPFDLFSSRLLRRYRVEGELTVVPRPMTGTMIYPRFAMFPVQRIAEYSFKEIPPPGWQAAGSDLISPPLPPECRSIGFEIDGRIRPQTVVRLVRGGKVINKTAGVPGRLPLRTRWEAKGCASEECRIVISNLSPSPEAQGVPPFPMSVRDMAFER